MKARSKNDFKTFEPKLKKLVELKRKEAELLGYENHPYNALLNLYEPLQTVSDTDVLFDDLKKELVQEYQKLKWKLSSCKDFYNDLEFP